MDNTLFDLIDAVDQAVLEVVDADKGKMKLIAGNGLWIQAIFANAAITSICTIGDNSPFLQDFLIDAKEVWNTPFNGKLRSGFWTEVVANDQELHLEATAIKYNEHQLLLISNIADEFKRQQTTLQSARDLLLSNNKLVEQNEYLHTRILGILNTPQQQAKVLIALTKAIEIAGFAVLITDGEFNTLIENSAAKNIFQSSSNKSKTHKQSIDIILDLLKDQLPEYERIIKTLSGWDGEVCWIIPPSTLKWLKISLYPVKNEFNEVKNWIIFANDISKIKYLVQKNEQLALQDMLTRLPNRFSFWQNLENTINNNTPFYLLYVDINGFRLHNEYFGHEEGDNLLLEISKRIKNTLSEDDYVARVGGDEFGIILANIETQEQCSAAIESLVEQISLPYFTSNNENINISVSVGAASYPHDATSVETLMKFVDLSAYSGKERNKNSVLFYSQSITDASEQIIKLERELKRAVKNNEFQLYFQPIINIEENKINKAEALIRWNHPKSGMLSPQMFIPIAEKSELINTIGHWVIRETCRIAKKLYDEGHRIKLSMNLSPSQVLEDDLFSYIHQCIKKFKVEPHLLELEVTENVLVNDYVVANKLLSKVRAIGMSVSIDDFGTGYSSLNYLKKLPLDFVKIDQSFIRDIVNDDNDKAIVRAVIAMAHNLNLGVTAEGVESKEQLSFLQNNSCNSVQGFLFSRPVSYDDFLVFLAQFKADKQSTKS